LTCRILADDTEPADLLGRTFNRLLPVVADRFQSAEVEMPRGLIVVGHPQRGHSNAGELVVRPRGFAWIWIDLSDEAMPRLEWTAAHEVVHLLVAGASAWPVWPTASSIGQRIVGEYLANRFAGEVLTEAGIAAPAATYDPAEVRWVVGLAKHARRTACRLLGGDAEPRDLARVQESVRLLARDYAYALGRTTAAAAADPEAKWLIDWIEANAPLIARVVEPLKIAGRHLAPGASLTELALFQSRVGGEIDAILEPILQGDVAAELAA
jgi:hypothetical protein